MQPFWISRSLEKAGIAEFFVFFKKLALSKKEVVLKKYFFWKSSSAEKSSCSEKFDSVWKYLLRKDSSSVGIFILNKFALGTTSWCRKVAARKNYLYLSSCSGDVLLWKSSFFENITSEKKWLFWKCSRSKKVAILKKWLLRKSNDWVELATLRK